MVLLNCDPVRPSTSRIIAIQSTILHLRQATEPLDPGGFRQVVFSVAMA
ncbi:hypothetical protein ATK30_0909 [Amycolatopsis echigonensis]|uniref:Uncharacterized protein n=1 Tax=Amycolatopsis echigonensis TaxID=2576905 RepID=A0A2N3X1B7_9PSEU|nr:hypothetical protein ATK30_0909 [Amycolatopsis niigatensis]